MKFNAKLLKEKETKKSMGEFIPGQAFIWKTFSHDEVGICVFIERSVGGMNTFICLNNMKIYCNCDSETKYTIIGIECVDVDYVNVREGEI